MKIQINNLDINYSETYFGNENNPTTILFIHGNSLSNEYFTKQLNSNLNNHFRLIALDLPGHGNSEKSDHYSFPLLVEVVQEFIKKKITSNFFVVGHSLGGHIASSLLDKSFSIFTANPVKIRQLLIFLVILMIDFCYASS